MVARVFLVAVVARAVVARAFLVAVVVGLGQWLLEYSWWQWLLGQWLLEHSWWQWL